MSQAATLKNDSLSPCKMVLDMLENILDQPTMDIHEKLDELLELCVERISFDSPERAVQIISVLAKIIASDPNPKVRVAALKVMERMIALEEKAEAEHGKPAINWHMVNVLLHKAQKQTERDTLVVTAQPGLIAPLPVAERPQPHAMGTLAMEEGARPQTIMRFLRSIANTDDQEHIRTLANRVIAKIENLTVQESPSPSALTLTEG